MPSQTSTMPNSLPEQHSEIRLLRARLQDVIVDTDDGMLEPLMAALKPMEMKFSKAPAAGLIMMSVKGSCGTVFHLGEVLVTEAQVSLLDLTGYGCCIGERYEAAVALACLDVLGRAERPAGMERIKSAIERICRAVNRKRKMELEMAAATRVDFRSMAEE